MTQDYKCAPNKKFREGSCFTISELKKMSNAYNGFVDKGEIKSNKIIVSNNKKNLLEQLTSKLEKTCTDQICWLKQNFVKNLHDDVLNDTFRPKGPNGKIEWLSTTHINNVMNQYENKFNDFKFFGAVPNDFDKLSFLGIKDTDYSKLYNSGKRRLGYVFNLDEHWQSGSHWVAMYANLENNQIYYFDSYGKKPDKRIRTLAKRIGKWMFTNNCKECRGNIDSESVMNVNEKSKLEKKLDIEYNHNRHQYKSSECGVYSMNFIIRLLNGETFNKITEERMSDDEVNRCRDKFFVLSKPFDELK